MDEVALREQYYECSNTADQTKIDDSSTNQKQDEDYVWYIQK